MISLNYRDSRPIYEQIKDGLRRMIAAGVMEAHEKLPSVRALATELTINPNTIQRAYAELAKAALWPKAAGRRTQENRNFLPSSAPFPRS